MKVAVLEVGPLETNCYLVGDRGLPGLLVDPGDEPGRVRTALSGAGFSSLVVVNTHGHFDHAGANGLAAEAGARLLAHRLDEPMLALAGEHRAYFLGPGPHPEVPLPDGFLEEGDELAVGAGTLRVLHTPGHSPGSICLVGAGVLFSGDTLFAGDIGRTDLEGGDPAAMRFSLARLLELPDETVVYPGHGPATSIGRERAMLKSLSGTR